MDFTALAMVRVWAAYSVNHVPAHFCRETIWYVFELENDVFYVRSR